jgi:GNAT superfamily N-acetyltransferase
MRAEQVEGPDAFFAATGALRAAHPLLTNIFTTVGTKIDVVRPDEGSQWWLVRDGRDVVGAAMWTPPFPLVCTPMHPDAADALGTALAATTPRAEIVAGPHDVVPAVLRTLAPGHHVVPTMAETLYLLGELVGPVGVQGGPRAAHAGELEDLARWHGEFNREAGLPDVDMPDLLLEKVADGALWWWELDGRRVSLAGRAAVVGDPADAVGRIGPVYTPAPFRRHGYGAAVTAHVAALLQQRCAQVVLFADDANATSNGVYRRLGFAPVAHWIEVPVPPAGGAPRAAAP